MLKLNDLYIFGVSIGGIIGQLIALKKPESVKKLLLASSFCTMNDYFKKTITRWLEYARNNKILELNNDFYHCCFSKEYLDTYKDALKTSLNVGTNKDCVEFAQTLQTIMDIDYTDKVKNIKCDRYIIASKHDKVLGEDTGLKLKNILNCDAYIYEKYSHAVYDEAPDYKQRILDYFK